MNDELQLYNQARAGDREALAGLIQMHRPRLKRMISMRLDRRVWQRVDDSDVVQEVFMRLDTSKENRETPHVAEAQFTPFLWLRQIALWTLGDLQRKHLGVKQRDPRRESHGGELNFASSIDLARVLIDSDIEPLSAIVGQELSEELMEVLEELEPLDREILMLRHVEQLTRAETAALLDISIAAAAKRYTRALARIRQRMDDSQS